MINLAACAGPVERTVADDGKAEEEKTDTPAQTTEVEQKTEQISVNYGTGFGAAFRTAGQAVSFAAQDFQPIPLNADGSLALTYDDLVGRREAEDPTAKMEAFFSDALFIGDSRTVGLARYTKLNGVDFFALTGMSVFDAFKSEAKLDPNAPDGTEIDLETLLTTKQYNKIYLMLGINELGYNLSSIERKYEEVTARIKELQPQAKIWLQANMHVSQGRSDKDPVFNNTTINTLNEVIYQIAQRQETGWLDVNPVFDDENGHLSMDYTFDHTHIVGKHYDQWIYWIYMQTAR